MGKFTNFFPNSKNVNEMKVSLPQWAWRLWSAVRRSWRTSWQAPRRLGAGVLSVLITSSLSTGWRGRSSTFSTRSPALQRSYQVLKQWKHIISLQCSWGDNVLNRKPDGSIVVTSQGKERMLVDNGNRIEESIFDEIFPGFDQFSGKLFTVCRICVILRIILFSRKWKWSHNNRHEQQRY